MNAIIFPNINIFFRNYTIERELFMKLILDVCFPHFHFSLLKFNLVWSFWENYLCILLKGPQVDVYLFYYWYLMQDDHRHMSKCYNRSYGRNSVFSITRILFVTKQLVYKGNNKITELRTIFQRESKNSYVYKQIKSVNKRKTVKTVMTLTWYRHFQRNGGLNTHWIILYNVFICRSEITDTTIVPIWNFFSRNYKFVGTQTLHE